MPQLTRNFKLDVEVPTFLLFFAGAFTDSVTSNLLIYRTCYVILGYNQSECALLGSEHPDNITSQLEKASEPYASTIGMSRGIPVGLLSGICCLFVGSWTDKFGRKPIMILGFIGILISFILRVIFVLIPDISPWYIVISDIPVCLTGGFSCLVTVILCYISDVTTENDRGVKMALFQGVMSIALLAGNMSSAYVFYATNYVTVFLISTSVVLVCLLHVIFLLPESVNYSGDGNLKSNIKEIFQLRNIKDMAQATFKARPNKGRAVALMCISISAISLFLMFGEGSVIGLYLRAKFQWSLEHLNMVVSLVNVVDIMALILGTLLFERILKVPETLIILIGCISTLIASILRGIATTDIGIYVAAGVNCLSGLRSPMIRSLISKIVPAIEIGKFFSFIVTCETLLGLLGSPLYTEIYNNTINTNPGIFNFVTAGFNCVQILLSISVIVTYHFKTRQYHVLDDQVENEEVLDGQM